jgi:hypothetical protein
VWASCEQCVTSYEREGGFRSRVAGFQQAEVRVSRAGYALAAGVFSSSFFFLLLSSLSITSAPVM